MAVYVDDYRGLFQGKRFSHLIADTEAELDEFATELGLKPQWKQKGRHVHFDVSEGMRVKAIMLGAQQVTCRDLARIATNDAHHVRDERSAT